MASTITITCPECDTQLRASSEVLGKKIRCKACGATFAARGAGGKPAPAKPPAKGGKGAKAGKSGGKPAMDENDETPYGMKAEYIGRRCPDCANAMEEDDRICLSCGYDTLTREKARTRKVREITGFDIFKWLVPGILCVLTVFILLGGCAYYWVAIERETFGNEWYDFIGSLGMKVYVSVISLFIMYKCGRFAVKRLILHPSPPEIEEKFRVSDE
jgi:predicted Zn finger-like uncharacterized protein